MVREDPHLVVGLLALIRSLLGESSTAGTSVLSAWRMNRTGYPRICTQSYGSGTFWHHPVFIQPPLS
jgi:hypothetical protein